VQEGLFDKADDARRTTLMHTRDTIIDTTAARL
jgi:hypothetical protein